jgi:hypothetical protein
MATTITKRLLPLMACASIVFSYCTTQHPTGSIEEQFTLLPIPKKIELLNDDPSSPGNINIDKKIDTSVNLPSPEGYILEIKGNSASITAKDSAGIFYGDQTLHQLVQDATDQNISIPSCRITDYPDIAYRAIHLDLKHHLDSLSYYYKLMDRLAALKINAVIVELEDKLKYKSAPLVGASHAISIEDFTALSNYAKERNIEISPLVQGLGHASFILKHPEYKELRDDPTSDWSFDPLNPKTYELQFALYKDAIEATPHGKYLHIGGDEVGKLGMSALAKKSGMKPIELQMHWLKKVCDYAVQHNRIPIFWDDMLFKLSNLYETTYDPDIPEAEVEKRWTQNEKILNENIDLFPKNCVYMRWNYDYPELPGNKKAIAWYASHGLHAMAATSGQQIWPMLPRASSNFQSIKDFSKITAAQHLDGILLTLWDDTSPHFETFWRGIHDYALFTWNYSDMPKENAHALFRKRFYGPQLGDEKYAFQDMLERGATFWETALINSGDRDNYPKKIDTLDLPDPNNSGAWSNKQAKRLTDARTEMKRYDSVKQSIADAMSVAKRNEYALQLFNNINELEMYPAQLLLLIEKYDLEKDPQQKDQAKKAVAEYAAAFDKIRKNYEDVSTRSRTLQNPSDYLPDQNHHAHLANGTNTSDWMYVYELAMNEKIKQSFNR